MPKIKDLIEVPPVRTVIELATVRDATSLQTGDADDQHMVPVRELLETFVVTEDIERNLRIIFDRIIRHPDEGMGFFLTGSFGSGKSHFLSILSIVFQYPWAWKYLTAQCGTLAEYESSLKDKKFLVVEIPLLEYSKADPLEDIFWNNVELALSSPKYKIFVPLSQSSYFLEQFERYVLPAHINELDLFIKSKLSGKYTWETIRRESANDAILLAQEFLKVYRQDIPFKLTIERQRAWDKLMEILNEHDFAGMLILMDELSEFLKSKPDSRSLNEDARFLQFIGEKSMHSPVWIIGALQESIERTGDISYSVFNKIKDRYQRNLELSAKHIRELIDRRLVRKKEQSIPVIREAYHILRNSFSDLRISEDEFLQIYPIHPETLELLDINASLFSQRRGVVDFIHYQIKGDPSRQIEGIMDKDYIELLTPDKIFDHFALRIREMANTSGYYQIYKDYFERHIPRIFSDEIDQLYALKIVKILILLKISPTNQYRSVKQLSNMVLYNYTDVGGELNYEYLHQNILRRLETEASYIRVRRGEEPLSDVYYIDLESKAGDIIELKKRDIIMNLADMDQRILDVAFDQLVYGPLPLAHFKNAYSERKNIIWENTPRSGSVKLCNLLEVKESEVRQMIDNLRNSEDDFVVYMGVPFRVSEQREHFRQILSSFNDRFINSIIYWLPKELEDHQKIKTLKDFYAQYEILNEYSNDNTKVAMDIRESLKKTMEERVVQLREIIEELYFNGNVYTVQGEVSGIDLVDCKMQNFNNTLSRIIREPLRSVYPLHIAPDIELSTRRIVSDLIDDFIRPARVDDINSPHLRYLRNSIEGLAVPLGIARRRENGYDLSFEINRSPLLAAIVNLIPTKRAQEDENLEQTPFISYDSAYKQMRKSEYGVIAPIFELLITALMRKGQITAFKGGVQVSIANIGFPISSYIQNLQLGQLIGNEFRWQLTAISEAMLGEKLQDFDVEKQEDIWSRLCQLKETASKTIISCRQDLQKLVDQLSPSLVNISSVMEGLLKVLSVLAEIKPSLSSKEGLEHFLKSLPSKLSNKDDIRSLIGRIQLIKSFVEQDMQNLFNIWDYITSPSLVIPDDEKYRHLRLLRDEVRELVRVDEKFIFEGGMERLRSAFRQFKQAFISIYASEHKAFNERQQETDISNIKNSVHYQILSQLSKISHVSVANDLSRIDKIIESTVVPPCYKLIHEQLERFPVCSCGYKLGMKVDNTGQDIMKLMEQSIRQYISALQDELYLKQIREYMLKMRQIGQSIPEKEINELLALDPDMPIDQAKYILSRVLTPIVIQHINRAFSNNIIIVKRNISQLYSDLVNKRYPKSKVYEIINRWIEGTEKLPDDAYLMIEE